MSSQGVNVATAKREDSLLSVGKCSKRLDTPNPHWASAAESVTRISKVVDQRAHFLMLSAPAVAKEYSVGWAAIALTLFLW